VINLLFATGSGPPRLAEPGTTAATGPDEGHAGGRPTSRGRGAFVRALRELTVREFGFELSLCARLEQEREAVVSRQLGAGVYGRRVLDTVLVEPGPEFETRAAITAETVPAAAVESDVGPGRARFWRDAFDCHPERARKALERAVEVGFFERERRGGRTHVRQTTRYPEDWFDSVVGVENKPDLDRPGALETQLLTDVHIAVLDRVVLATASHVTGAHLNRIPEPVGVWEVDPDAGGRTVVRPAQQLPVACHGVEIRERQPARTAVEIVTPEEKARARRRLAERAYGKGWRTYDTPACARVDPDDDGLPYCPWKNRVVRPATDCGPACDGHEPADPPDLDRERLRASRTPWNPEPGGRQRRQAGLDRYHDG
jgi:hypothetical protein